VEKVFRNALHNKFFDSLEMGSQHYVLHYGWYVA